MGDVKNAPASLKEGKVLFYALRFYLQQTVTVFASFCCTACRSLDALLKWKYLPQFPSNSLLLKRNFHHGFVQNR